MVLTRSAQTGPGRFCSDRTGAGLTGVEGFRSCWTKSASFHAASEGVPALILASVWKWKSFGNVMDGTVFLGGGSGTCQSPGRFR